MRQLLTPRQYEVAIRIAIGRTNAEIADELGIDQKTVDTHRSAALKRLTVRSNVELARYAVASGDAPAPMLSNGALVQATVS